MSFKNVPNLLHHQQESVERRSIWSEGTQYMSENPVMTVYVGVLVWV